MYYISTVNKYKFELNWIEFITPSSQSNGIQQYIWSSYTVGVVVVMMDGHCGAILGLTYTYTISQCRSPNKLWVYGKVYSKQLYI
jgi:hypothetical protein